MLSRTALLAAWSLATLGACGSSGSSSNDAGPPPDLGAPEAAAPGPDAEPDAGVEPDAGPAPDAGPPRPPDLCDALGLPRIAFTTEGAGDTFGELAGDFTVETLDGPWNLRDAWTGCESYVVFVHFPGQTDALFETTFDLLFTEGPRNVQYFFLSMDEDPAAREAFARARAQDLEDGFAFRGTPPEEQERWRPRFHFALDRATDPGSLGAFVTTYLEYAASRDAIVDLGDRGLARPPLPVVFGIDRAQRLDAADNLAPSVGQAPRLDMARFLGMFYDYRAELETRLAAEADATVVTLLDERTTARTFTRAATLPAAGAMAAFDTLQLDVEIDCTARNPFACSEWDRIASVQLCLDGEACTDRRELGRWITPYWRRGRQHYLLEATPMLGLLREGGERFFFLELGPDWERATEWDARIELRLRASGAGPTPIGAERAFVGGAFDAAYNTREPFTFTPPAGTTRVELVTLLSGHGQTSGDSCAEWCDHRHDFRVNGVDLEEIAFPEEEIGNPYGCGFRAREGVIPGQWGNWSQSRAYWCPGLAVQPRRADITERCSLGAPNVLEYEGRFRRGAPNGGDIALSAYVVYYRD